MVNADGTKGPHWTLEQTEIVKHQRGIQWDPVEFWACMAMIYSDYSEVFRTYGVRDQIYLYADMAQAFLEEADAKPGKLARYYLCAVNTDADPKEEGANRMIRTEPKTHVMGDADHKPFSAEMAQEWADHMRNSDGTTGPHWSLDQAKHVMAQKRIDGSPIAFWISMNTVYAVYGGVAKKLGVNTIDFYASMAEAFLNDKEAVKDKLSAYYGSVIDH